LLDKKDKNILKQIMLQQSFFKKALQRISDQIDTAKEQAGTFRKDKYGSQAQLK